VTSGYLPLGGVIVSGRVAEPFWSEPGAVPFRHGPTYSGHATCCAAGLANLDIMERESLVGRGRELEGELLAALEPLAGHPLVGEVRGGLGLLGAVDLGADVLERLPGAPWRLYVAIREAGVLLRPLAKGVAISPPLVIGRDEIRQIADAIRAGLDTLQATL
jgi:adenosylmethionine-8-amino-7-oxononanoate aminotransferase